jgi:hypothetical protein
MKKNKLFKCFFHYALMIGILLFFSLTLGSCEKKECPLSNALTTPEEIATRFLTALENSDTTALWDLRVTEEEYKNIIWPAYQKIGYGLSDQPWFINMMDSRKAIGRAIGDYGGRKLKLVRIYFAKGKDEKVGDFTIWRDFRIVVENQQGEEEELDYINTVVEMYGGYKVVVYHS